MESAISFEQYPAAKKCLGGCSTCMIGELGEPYCTIPDECLKLLNKFLGMTIYNSKTEFCKKDVGNFLFSVDKEYYWIDIRLSTKA